ncbi:MAG: hypothetical protein LBL90_13045 [Prevotellaceae bacterium]|jgi:hypothetical protein|nr:hypothetical protein [Prevotellaceae bacterium]
MMQVERYFVVVLTKAAGKDFKLLKNSRVYLKEGSKCLVDTGYLRIQKIHHNSEHPKNKSKKETSGKRGQKV